MAQLRRSQISFHGVRWVLADDEAGTLPGWPDVLPQIGTDADEAGPAVFLGDAEGAGELPVPSGMWLELKRA